MARVLTCPVRAPANDWPAIPGFEILRVVDQGGMGVVYQARQVSLDRVVALKVIRPDWRANAEAVKRFEREARAAARLTHPHVITVYHAGRAGNLHYLVLEYVDGTDLARLVHRQGPLPVPRAADYLRQAALGLQHLLDCGLVHRDIKPGNLLLSEERESTGGSRSSHASVIKIADLGLARLLHPGEDSSLTQGGMIGTPDYVAPEQAEDPHRVDIRSDLYSLGCTLYYLLTGRPPFPDGTMVHKLDMHRWGTPAPLDRLRPDVPPDLALIAARLLAKKPAERFQTPVELAEALQPLAGPAAAPPAVATARTRIDDRAPTLVKPQARADRVVGDSGWWLSGHTAAVSCIAFTPDGRCLSGSFDESIRLWDLTTGTEARAFPGHPGGVTALAVTADGQSVVSGGRDGKLRVRDLHSGAEVRVLDAHKGEVHGLALAGDSRRAVSAGQDQCLRQWDWTKGRESRRLGGTVAERHWDAVLCVALSGDGGQALSGSRDGTARLWDLASGRQRRCLGGHHAAVMAVALAGDGRTALTAAGLTTRLWDLESGQVTCVLAGHAQPVLAAGFAPDGRSIVTAGQDGSVRLWDRATGQEVARFEGHAGWVLCAGFTPDGRHVLAGAADGRVCLWPVASG